MKGYKKGIRMGLCFALALSLLACGKKDAEVPELLEPVENRDAIHTVTREDLKSVTYKEGWVSPEYVTFEPSFTTSVSELEVKLGDKVSEGQELLRLNAELQEQMETLQRELKAQERAYELLQKQQEEQLDALKQQKKMFQDMGDNYNAKLTDISIRQSEYEFSFRNADTQRQIEEMKETLADCEEEAKRSVVTAPCDGTVSYLSAEEGQQIDAGIVYLVLAKDDALHLVCEYLSENTVDSYQQIQVQIGAELYDVEHLPYTEEELYELEEAGGPTESNFRSDSLPDSVQAGDYVAFLFTKVKENVLTVPTEAIESENGRNYVNIYKNGNLERREVELGQSSLNRTEITEGIQEQEQVFVAKNRESYSAKPETVQAQRGDFVREYKMTGAERHAAWLGVLENKVPGTIKELLIQNVSEVCVEEGQALYVITADISDVDVAQAQLDLKNAQKEYDKQTAQYEEQIKNQKALIKEITDKTEKELAQSDLEAMQQEYDQYVEEGTENLKTLAERAENFAEWQGKDVTVYAEQDCVVESFSSLRVGSELAENDFICNLLDDNTFTIRVNDPEGQLHYGQKLIYQSTKNGESISSEATVLFAEGVPGGNWSGETVIALDDPEMYLQANNTGTLLFQRCEVSNVLLLSTKALRTASVSVESGENADNVWDASDADEPQQVFSYYYVWVYDENGVAVRREVEVGESYYENAWIIDGLSEDDVVIKP
ncbi:MAG: hypothetical protein Q4C48_00060 [Lachnospiraceae bacterium]|nr:hypothetical protein [Lachnospiraceae bacterium]